MHIMPSKQPSCTPPILWIRLSVRVIRTFSTAISHRYTNRPYSNGDPSEEWIGHDEMMKQLQCHYGIITAQLCDMPEEVIRYAQSIVSKIKIKTIRCDCIRRQQMTCSL